MGGDDYKKMVFLVMSKILTKGLAMQYSLHGRKGMKPFAVLSIHGAVAGNRP